MANVYGHKQWKLDTGGVITTDRVTIQKMKWLPNAASDDLVLVDNNSEDIWRITDIAGGGEANAKFLDFGDAGFTAEGFNVSTLGSSCVLNVWLR